MYALAFRNTIVLTVIAICSAASITNEELAKILDDSHRSVVVPNLGEYDADLRLDSLRDKLRTFGSLEADNEDLYPDQDAPLVADGDINIEIGIDDTRSNLLNDILRAQSMHLVLVEPEDAGPKKSKRWYEKGAFAELSRATRGDLEDPVSNTNDLTLPNSLDTRSFGRPQPWMFPTGVTIPSIRSENQDLDRNVRFPQMNPWLFPDGVKIPSVKSTETNVVKRPFCNGYFGCGHGKRLIPDLDRNVRFPQMNPWMFPSGIKIPTVRSARSSSDNLIESRRFWLSPSDVKIPAVRSTYDSSYLDAIAPPAMQKAPLIDDGENTRSFTSDTTVVKRPFCNGYFGCGHGKRLLSRNFEKFKIYDDDTAVDPTDQRSVLINPAALPPDSQQYRQKRMKRAVKGSLLLSKVMPIDIKTIWRKSEAKKSTIEEKSKKGLLRHQQCPAGDYSCIYGKRTPLSRDVLNKNKAMM